MAWLPPCSERTCAHRNKEGDFSSLFCEIWVSILWETRWELRTGTSKIEGIPIKFKDDLRDTIKFGYNFWLDLDPFWSMSQSCCVNLSQPPRTMGPWTGTFLLANNEPTTGLHHPPRMSESYCSVFECICYLNLFDYSVVSSIFKYTFLPALYILWWTNIAIENGHL